MSLKKIFVRTQRTIGAVQLDAVVNEDHTNTVAITKNPVEAGIDITDHAIIQPKKLSIQGVVSDSPLGLAAFGQIIDSVTRLFGTSTVDNLTRSQQAYQAMVLLMEEREPIQVDTGLRQYNEMLITSLSSAQDKDTSSIVIMNISLEEIIVTVSSVIAVPEESIDPAVAKSGSAPVDKGKEELIPVVSDEEGTVLKQLIEWLSGTE